MADSIPNDIPKKCQECRKSSKQFIHDGCSFCQDLNIQEEILCYLNQSSQDPSNFECHAYRPMLKLVASDKKKIIPETKGLSAKTIIENQLNSDRVKYKKALALQKLTVDCRAMIPKKCHGVLPFRARVKPGSITLSGFE